MRSDNGRILIVDDQKEGIELFRRALEDSGYRVVLCTDADAAIDLFDDMEDEFLTSFNLVVLDMLMRLPSAAKPDTIAGEHAVGAFLLNHLRSWNEYVPIVVFTHLKPSDVMEDIWPVFVGSEARQNATVPQEGNMRQREELLRTQFRLWLWAKVDYLPWTFVNAIREIALPVGSPDAQRRADL